MSTTTPSGTCSSSSRCVPAAIQTASGNDVVVTPMKVVVLDTATKAEVFKRFHDWRLKHSDIVVASGLAG